MSKVALHPRVSEFLSQKPVPAFIGGRWVAGSAGAADVIDPATGAAIGQVSMAGPDDVNTAVESAHQAFAKWSGMSVNERAALLHRLAEKITEASEVLAQLEAIDVGKPVVNARGFDVPFGADCIRYFADLSKQATHAERLIPTLHTSSGSPSGPSRLIFACPAPVIWTCAGSWSSV